MARNRDERGTRYQYADAAAATATTTPMRRLPSESVENADGPTRHGARPS
jgi:hypothetical protein